MVLGSRGPAANKPHGNNRVNVADEKKPSVHQSPFFAQNADPCGVFFLCRIF